MKFLTALLVAAVACTSAVHAAECTTADVATLQTNPAALAATKTCPGITGDSILDDKNAEIMCKNTDCLAAMRDLIKALPDCTVNGISMKDSNPSDMFDKACKELGVSSAASGSTAENSVAVAAAVASFAIVRGL